MLFAAFALIRSVAGRISLVRSSASMYVRSAKRNIRNECAILIRRVKGTLREECGYTPRVCLATCYVTVERASVGAHATRDYSSRRVVGRKGWVCVCVCVCVCGSATETPESSFDRDVANGIQNDSR